MAGRWYDRGGSAGRTGEQCWDALDRIGSKSDPVYVVCPRAGVALTLLGWWDQVKAGRYVVWRTGEKVNDAGEVIDPGKRRSTHPLIISGCPDIVGYEHDGKTYRWVNTLNFGKPALDLDGRADEVATRVADWIVPILSSWLDTGCGPWRDSVGAAAWGTFTLRMTADPIVTHTHPAAQQLEDQACHGGRASIWTIRPVGGKSEWHDYPPCPPYPAKLKPLAGPIHRVDVRAMYPTILRDREFPVRLRGFHVGWSVDRLRDSLGGSLKIARVTLRTDRPEYPFRRNGRVLYPVGQFTTTLAGPELETALAAGAVIEVHQVALYERGQPFRLWGEWVLGLRERAAARNVPGWSAYVKHISVALSGKLASKPGGWVPSPGTTPLREWGEWVRMDADTGEETLYRSLGQHVQRYEQTGLRPGTLAACYAFLTAYGRCQMKDARSVAGHRQTIAQHTDGLLVTTAGLDALSQAGLLHPTEFGRLRHEGAFRVAYFRGPNHFWADGAWTVAGIAGGHTVRPTGELEEVVTIDPARSARDPTARMVYERIRRVDPARINNGDTFDRDGWVIPPRAGSPSAPRGTPTLFPDDQT